MFAYCINCIICIRTLQIITIKSSPEQFGIAIAITPLFWVLTRISQVRERLWLYLIIFHLFLGGTWAAIDLENNNIQIGIAPIEHHATFLAIVSAIAGIAVFK